jgi:hypothetical protein
MNFTKLSQARSTFDSLMNRFGAFLLKNVPYRDMPYEDIPISVLENKHVLDLQLQDWKLAYDNFCKEPISKASKILENDQKRGLQLLEIHCGTLQLYMQSTLPNNPTIFGDSPNPLIETILHKAEELIMSSGQWGQDRRIFSAETGIVAILFSIAMKVTDPNISSRAVHLLLRCNKREGLYDSNKMAYIILELQRTHRTSSNIALESAAAHIADLPGGIGSIAQILGIEQDI